MWKGIRVVRPPISYSSSARSMRAVAASRSVSHTISFATIGSYIGEISDPGLDAGVDAYARPCRFTVGGNRAGSRCEFFMCGLRVDAALDRAPAQLHVLLGK